MAAFCTESESGGDAVESVEDAIFSGTLDKLTRFVLRKRMGVDGDSNENSEQFETKPMWGRLHKALHVRGEDEDTAAMPGIPRKDELLGVCDGEGQLLFEQVQAISRGAAAWNRDTACRGKKVEFLAMSQRQIREALFNLTGRRYRSRAERHEVQIATDRVIEMTSSSSWEEGATATPFMTHTWPRSKYVVQDDDEAEQDEHNKTCERFQVYDKKEANHIVDEHQTEKVTTSTEHVVAEEDMRVQTVQTKKAWPADKTVS